MKRNTKGQFVKAAAKSTTGIVIEVERTLTNVGKRGLKIITLQALKEHALPREYTIQGKYCYMSKTDNTIYCNALHDSWVSIGDIVSEPYFTEIMAALAKCGTRLQEINAARRKLKKEWHGKKTYVI